MIRPETKLIVLAHASNVLGTVEPAREIGHIAAEHEIIFLLDAAQTAGALPIDLKEMKINLLACPGHKGLLGPTGTGVLAINDLEEIASFRERGTGSLSEEPVQPSRFPDRLEAGTPNTVGIAGLKAGLEFIMEKGLEKIRSHELSLIDLLLKGLLSIPGVTVYGTQRAEGRSGFVSFNIESWEPQDVAAVLESKFDIACRAGLHCAPWAHGFLGTLPYGAVRFSVGYYNTESEIKTAIKAVSALAGY